MLRDDCGVCPLVFAAGSAVRVVQLRCPTHGPDGPHITRRDRDDLALLAAGQPHTGRAIHLSGDSPRRAGELVALWDRLAEVPVAELSPLGRVPAVVTPMEA